MFDHVENRSQLERVERNSDNDMGDKANENLSRTRRECNGYAQYIGSAVNKTDVVVIMRQ